MQPFRYEIIARSVDMSMTLTQKLATALSLSVISLGTIAATPAMARDHYRVGDTYRNYDRGYNKARYHKANKHYSRDYYRDGRYYKDSRSYRGDRYRCRDNGTGGAIIGAAAGGLLGNQVAKRGDKTVGTVLGAILGGVAGHAIDKSDGRRC